MVMVNVLSLTEYYRIKRRAEEAQATLLQSLPELRHLMFSYFPTLLHPQSFAGAFSLAPRDDFSILITQSSKQRLAGYQAGQRHSRTGRRREVRACAPLSNQHAQAREHAG
jgi:hypothetical protein